jgi:replicative DNA helicase
MLNLTLECEQGVIGALLLDASALDRIGSLPVSCFQAEAHRLIYGAILACSSAGKPVDALSVGDELERTGKLESVGGMSYIAAVSCGTTSIANVARHAEMVRERALERDMLAAAADITECVSKPGSIREKVDFVQSRVMQVTESESREPLTLDSLVDRYADSLDARSSGGGGLKTHFVDLDKKLGGLQDGDLVIIAARPSMGKTALAMQIAENNAKNGVPVGVLSMEMSSNQLLDRIVSGRSGIPLEDIVTGRRATDDFVYSALTDIRHWPLIIDDSAALTAMEVRTKARSMKRKHGIKLLVVDYLQLMSSDIDNPVHAVQAISRSLKALGKELHIPVVALSQLSRECEKRIDKRPILSDLRDSGAIEQDADVVIFVYREEQYQPNASQWKGLAEFLIRKNRQGSTGDVHMTWRGKCTRFENFAGEWPSNVEPMRRRKGFGDD